jgi:hypothetical protein
VPTAASKKVTLATESKFEQQNKVTFRFILKEHFKFDWHGNTNIVGIWIDFQVKVPEHF